MHIATATNWPASLAGAPRAPRSELPRNVGERHPKARLSDHEVELMRALHDEDPVRWGFRALGRKFEVRWETARSICTGRTR